MSDGSDPTHRIFYEVFFEICRATLSVRFHYEVGSCKVGDLRSGGVLAKWAIAKWCYTCHFGASVVNWSTEKYKIYKKAREAQKKPCVTTREARK